eukprot:1986677-Ditylum_brightwellii.AAC.1
MHFEIRRPKHSDDPTEDEERRLEEEPPADTTKDNKHGDKEIVGYWEDGLAIYADGTREEKPVEDEEEMEHRKLLEAQSPDLDKE